MRHIYKNEMRFHLTPLGALPGVTTILSKTQSLESRQAIAGWRGRVGEMEANRIKKAAIARGTMLHTAVEKYLRLGLEPEGEIANPFNKMKNLLSKIKTVHLIETHTHSQLGYAGTPDLVAEYDGKLAVFDWKTSSKPKKRQWVRDYFIQIAAYSKSVEECFNLKCDIGYCIIIPFTNDDIQIFKISKHYKDKYFDEFLGRLDTFQNLYGNLYF